MHLIDLLVGCLAVFIVGFVFIGSRRKQKKQGSCGSGCGRCPYLDDCQQKEKEKRRK